MELKALKLYIFTTTLLLLSVLKAPAATEYAHFVHYSTNDGMASNRILYIEPDPEGHLWIATDFGVDRFNGKKFKHYQGDGTLSNTSATANWKPAARTVFCKNTT